MSTDSVSQVQVVFDGDVRCTRGADGSSMQLHGRSGIDSNGAGGDLDFFWRDVSLPELPASLSQVHLHELGSPAQSPRRFELRSSQAQLQFSAAAVQLHRAVGRAMFAVVPPQPVPRWLRAAWWLLLSLLRVPGVGKLLLSSRGGV